MGRSAEDDRDVLALPMQRPRRHVPGGATPTRVHPPSFDPDAARKAWRQVARVRGGGPGLGVDSPRRPIGPALMGVLLAVGVVWGMVSLTDSTPDVPPPAQMAAAAVTESPKAEPKAEPSSTAVPAPANPAAVPMPESSIGQFQPAHAAGPRTRMAPPATEDSTQQAAPRAPAKTSASWRSSIPMPSEPAPSPTAPVAAAAVPAGPPPTSAPPLVRRGPPVSPESPPAGVAALRKLPKGARDRPPLDGVGVSGIHVDRLDLGSAYDDGVCQGSNRSYAESTVKAVNVCFRVVHRRQTERVLVKWSKNGRLVRRAWIVIPAAHAYRTRAGLRLRDSHVGNWTVTVESTDGVVLASGDFKVTP